MTSADREIVKGYGGWTQFMHSFGLKPHKQGDIQEATMILKGLAK
jgi:hypothetical protein